MRTFASGNQIILVIFDGGRKAQMWDRARVAVTSQRHNFGYIGSWVGVSGELSE
jgi:hypothetical protein